MKMLLEPNSTTEETALEIIKPVIDESYSIEESLEELADIDNIAELLPEFELTRLGHAVVESYDIDLKSRGDWEKRNEAIIEVSKMLKEEKNKPFRGASNIKMPTIVIACLQYTARFMSAIYRDEQPFKGMVKNKEQSPKLQEVADRVGHHISYEVTEVMQNWLEELEELILHQALVGLGFRKTYRDKGNDQNCSDYLYWDDVVIPAGTKNLEKASRISHKYYVSSNELYEYVMSGVFLDQNIGEGQEQNEEQGPQSQQQDKQDKEGQFLLIEQHCYYDLDGDGYKEPYIVTVHYDTGKVLRIKARWYDHHEYIVRNEQGQLIKINPIHYFTDFKLFPALDGSYYPNGFGTLLYANNDATNSTLNMIFDAGKRQNAGGGFVSDRIKVKNRYVEYKPGEFIVVSVNGPRPIGDYVYERNEPGPSPVLFNALGFLNEQNEKLSNVMDIMTGQSGKQNEAVGTILAKIEQAMQLYNWVHHRQWRSLKEEARKLVELNRVFVDSEYEFTTYNNVQVQGQQGDYQEDKVYVVPTANPNSVTNMQEIMKAEGLKAIPGLNQIEVITRLLKAYGITDYDKLLPSEEQLNQPPPEIMKMQSEAAIEEKKTELEFQKLAFEREKWLYEREKIMAETASKKAAGIKSLSDAEANEPGIQNPTYEELIKQWEEQTSRELKQTQELNKMEKMINESGGNNQGAMAGVAQASNNGGVAQTGSNPSSGTGSPGLY